MVTLKRHYRKRFESLPLRHFFLPGNGLTGKAGGHPEVIRRRPVRFRELVYELPEEVSRPAAPCVAVAVHEAVSVAGIHLVRRVVEFRERIAFTPQHPSPVFVDDAPDILPSAQRPSSLKHRVPEIRRPRLQDILRPEDGVPHPFGDFRRRNLREYEPHLGCPFFAIFGLPVSCTLSDFILHPGMPGEEFQPFDGDPVFLLRTGRLVWNGHFQQTGFNQGVDVLSLDVHPAVHHKHFADSSKSRRTFTQT